jgi:ribosomal protein S12 methylthiotransferase
MLKAGFISLGCAKNLVDTEVMLGSLKEHGIEITPNPYEAEILIVNTCSFIKSAKEESITTVLNMAEYKTKGKCRSLIVAGCLGERYREELLDEMPEVDAIVGTGSWHRIVEAIEATLEGKRVVIADEKKNIYDEKMTRLMTTPEYRAYVKVADGCDNRCAYCVIPKVRGSFRSRSLESIVSEVKNLVANGVKEIDLIAQDTTSYGRDLYGKPQLVKLLKELVKISDLKWIRILYCYPKYFTDELIDLMASEEKICKYVDLPLQHADDGVMRAMNRHDTRESVEELLKKLRARIPNLTLRTSFIVGFPGETDEQYKNLRDFVEKQRFDKVGVFTYSREEDTPAYDMPNQITDEVMQERYHDLMSLQCKISEELNQNLEGSILEVLIEGRDEEQENVAYGRSYREAPEVDGQVYVEGDSDSKIGDIIKVRVIQGFTYDVLGEKITE